MNYGDHNFIEITQQTKLRVALVVSSESSCAVRQWRHSQNAWARYVVSSRAKWNLGLSCSCRRAHITKSVSTYIINTTFWLVHGDMRDPGLVFGEARTCFVATGLTVHFSSHLAGRVTTTTDNSKNDAKAFCRAPISLDMQDDWLYSRVDWAARLPRICEVGRLVRRPHVMLKYVNRLPP